METARRRAELLGDPLVPGLGGQGSKGCGLTPPRPEVVGEARKPEIYVEPPNLRVCGRARVRTSGLQAS